MGALFLCLCPGYTCVDFVNSLGGGVDMAIVEILWRFCVFPGHFPRLNQFLRNRKHISPSQLKIQFSKLNFLPSQSNRKHILIIPLSFFFTNQSRIKQHI